jgi:uncharacterized protein
VSHSELLILATVGLFAGLLGGMTGLGGSLLIIPGLAYVFGPNQHLYQAAAMIVNFFVALPSAIQHTRAGSVRWDMGAKMLPFALVAIVVGVLVSDQFDGRVLERVFGAFLVYVVAFNVARLVKPRPEPLLHEYRTSWPFAGTTGSIMGFIAGLLGIGGGAIVVPLLQRIGNLPIRQSIGTSSAAMCITAIVGAAMKNGTLGQHEDLQNPDQMLRISDSVLLAGLLIPTAILGGWLGATLTRILPIWWVRLALVLVMSWASAHMLRLV